MNQLSTNSLQVVDKFHVKQLDTNTALYITFYQRSY